MLDQEKAEAQQAVDELLEEDLLPFKLNVGKVTSEPAGEYRVHFYDGRLHSVTVTSEPNQPFKDLVRTAVLGRIAEWSGPCLLYTSPSPRD